MNMSYALAHLSHSAGSVNTVTVPVDDRLEKSGRRWITAPDEVLRQLNFNQVRDEKQREGWRAFERSLLRREGVKALKYFQSDENIVLLRGLLNDPAWSNYEFERADGTEIEKKRYFVRKAAYDVLKNWGVAVERPVIDEPTDDEVRAQHERKVSGPSLPTKTVSSAEEWRSRKIEAESATLFVSLPATTRVSHLPLEIILANAGHDEFRAGETGYTLDCKLKLDTQNGERVNFTRHGHYLFSGDELSRGQYAIVLFRPGTLRHWKYDLADAFEQLKPGNYKLTLEARLMFWDVKSKDFSRPVVLVAQEIPVEIVPAAKD